MKHLRLPCLLLCTIALFTGGCAHYSQTNRQQRAYEKYIRKSSVARQHQRSRFQSGKPQMPMTPAASDPVVTSNESGPQAVPTDGQQ